MRLIHLDRLPLLLRVYPYALLAAGAGLAVAGAGEAVPEVLPVAKPPATAVDWVASPAVAWQRYQEAVTELLRAHQQVAQAKSWAAWIGGGVLGAIGLARIIPGVPGMVANVLWSLWAPKATKEQEQKRDVLADGFKQVAEIMRTFPRDAKLDHVLSKLERLPEPIKQAYREWERQHGSQRPPTQAQIAATARIAAELPPQEAGPSETALTES